MTRVLVTGGRHFANYSALALALAPLHPTVVITGAATGADSMASMWAKENGIPLIEMPAQWQKYGPGAGPIRNGWMLTHAKPDVVLAFPGNRGTADMVRRAKAAGIKVQAVTL